jgi:lipopolysaccharide export system protein LptA
MPGRSSRAVLAALVSVCIGTAFEGRRVGAEAEASAPKPVTTPRKPADQSDLFQSLALGSRKEPIRIHSDTLELDYKGSTLTYRGNVQVVQGDVTLDSDTLAITFERDEKPAGKKASASQPAEEKRAEAMADAVPGRGDADRIKEVVAEGRVKIRKGDRIAEGRRAVFDQTKQTIVLSDGAVLHEGPNQVAGDRIVVYLQEERSVVEGGSKSRVQAVFYPGSSAGADEAKRVEAAGSGARHDAKAEQR